MEWEPISEAKLWDNINNAFDRMSLEQRTIWEVIKIFPLLICLIRKYG
jgi:hypothetical protein